MGSREGGRARERWGGRERECCVYGCVYAHVCMCVCVCVEVRVLARGGGGIVRAGLLVHA